MSVTVTFAVYGTPRTNERHRHGRGITFTPSKTKAARREYVQAYLEAAGDREPHQGPFSMRIVITHFAKGAWSGKQCNVKPDLDNVAKLVGDALNGVAYRDDSQMRALSVEKGYGSISGVQVWLTFEEAIPKPRNGLLPHPVTKGCWQLWRDDRQIGHVVKVRGGYQAFADGELLVENFRTQKAAVEAIEDYLKPRSER